MNNTESTTSTIGFSDEAGNLLVHREAVENHAQDIGSVFYKLTKLIEELEIIYLDAANGNYDNYGASPVNVKTFREVYKFINLHPYDLKNLPDILLEPDGSIALDWENEQTEASFAISFNGSGLISFAGLFFDETNQRGTEKFDGFTIPDVVSKNILRIFKDK